MTNNPLGQNTSFDPDSYLEALGALEDGDIDLGAAALALAVQGHDGVSVDRYVQSLKRFAADVQTHFQREIDGGVQDTAQSRLAALRSVFADQHDFMGDLETYDDLQNASLIRVIDRAQGLPITLSILYITTARSLGWDVEGLSFPAHFICRIEHEGQRILFDPFHGASVLEAPDLRRILKTALGADVELSPEYYEAASNRDILIRLQNNIKFRQIDMEDYDGALKTVQGMRKIDPSEYRLLLDEGVLYARTDQPRAAVESLAAYIEKAPHSRDRMEAEMLLQQLATQMN